MMKFIFGTFVGAATAVATLFALAFFFNVDLMPNEAQTVPVFQDQSVKEEGTPLEYGAQRLREVVHHEEVQMNAIAQVAEAIVGVVNVREGVSTPFGIIGENQGGTGSGIVYAVRDGNTYIVTNEHVIEGASTIEVVFNNEAQNRFTAHLVGSDVYTDIAVLRIDNFEAEVVAQFGNTEDLRLGQTVIAIGNPLGLEFAGSVTMGVVSGHDRNVSIPITSTNGQTTHWPMTVLQTDTALNPGNSGGALINLAGEVIGINSMKIARATVEGMSFSIPTHVALPIIAQLEEFGEVVRPLLGVSLLNVGVLTQHDRNMINLPDDINFGVVVQEVATGSLAEEMGIEQRDVITHIGDNAISDFSRFRQLLFTYRSGDELVLTVMRDGESLTLNATITIEQNNDIY